MGGQLSLIPRLIYGNNPSPPAPEDFESGEYETEPTSKLTKLLKLFTVHIQESLDDESEASGSSYKDVIPEEENACSCYALKLPQKFFRTAVGDGQQLIFEHQKEVFEVMKKFPGSRFKKFDFFSEALLFCQSPIPDEDLQPKTSDALAAERVPYKSVKPADLLQLKRKVERGKVVDVEQAVRGNPRLLISSGDTPTMMHEGFRYTALHCAAKSNRAEMCSAIISLLEDLSLFSALYPLDEPATSQWRQKRVIDLYLNMPDKGFNETPLHFACKFGHVAVVKVLARHPLCDIDALNDEQKTPKQVAASRCRANKEEAKKAIVDALEERCYVPLLGPEDCSQFPKVGATWSPPARDTSQWNQTIENFPEVMSPTTGINHNSLSSDSLAVRAFAGPMSPSKAQEFRSRWQNLPRFSSPPVSASSSPARQSGLISPDLPKLESPRRITSPAISRLQNLKRTDIERGMERLGREIADDLAVPWREYWPFMKQHANLRERDGLKLLESWLVERSCNCFLEVLLSSLQRTKELVTDLLNEKMYDAKSIESTKMQTAAALSPISSLCIAFETWKLNSPESPGTQRTEQIPDSPGTRTTEKTPELAVNSNPSTPEVTCGALTEPGSVHKVYSPVFHNPTERHTPLTPRERSTRRQPSTNGGESVTRLKQTISTKEIVKQLQDTETKIREDTCNYLNEILSLYAKYEDLVVKADSQLPSIVFENFTCKRTEVGENIFPCIDIVEASTADVGDHPIDRSTASLFVKLLIPQLGFEVGVRVKEEFEDSGVDVVLSDALSSSGLKVPLLTIQLPLVDLNPPPLYIAGNEPSKIDQDVLLAMNNADLTDFPSISLWQSRVVRYDVNERLKWRSPAPPSLRRRIPRHESVKRNPRKLFID